MASASSSSSATGSESPESSRAREQQQRQDALFEPRAWVALSSVAIVLEADDPCAVMLLPGAEDLRLDLRPPSPPSGASYLLLPKRLVPDPRSLSFPYVVTACSDRLLFMATTGDGTRTFAYYLADAHARTTTRLPEVPAKLREFGLDLALRRSVGLIADPRHDGHYLVAQLHPASATRHDTLLCFSTYSSEWMAKPLASAPDHEPWGAHGVLAHGGMLWWIDVAYGLLACDPSAADHSLHLRFFPLPEGCQMQEQHLGDADAPRPTALLNKLRFVRASQGMLRYVEIRGVPFGVAAANTNPPPQLAPEVHLYSLVDMEGPGRWRHDFTASFANVWEHPTYADAGLPKDAVPSLALVDPNDPEIVYFFLGTTMFGLDLAAGEVVRRLELVVDAGREKLRFQTSCFVQAWEVPPALELLLDDDDDTSVDSDAGDELEFADPRHTVLEDMQCVQEKILVERDFVQLEKLFRERAHLRRVLVLLESLH